MLQPCDDALIMQVSCIFSALHVFLMLSTAVNYAFLAVKNFHYKFNHPAPDKPQAFGCDDYSRQISGVLQILSHHLKQTSKNRKVLRVAWVVEELSEYLVADNLVDEVDALCDAEYFIQGTFVEQGVEPGNSFVAVHEKNMSKIPSIAGEKVRKPKGWTGPENDIRKDLIRQGAIL